MVDPLRRHPLKTGVADAVEVEIESPEDDGFTVEPISTAQSENINDYCDDETDTEIMDDADSEAVLALTALASGTGVFGLMQGDDRSIKLAMNPEMTEGSFHALPAPPELVATPRFVSIQSQPQPAFNTNSSTTPDQDRLTAARTSTTETIKERSTYNAPGMFLERDQENSNMAELAPHSDAAKDVDRKRPVAKSGDQIAQALPFSPFDAMTPSGTSALVAMPTAATTITSSSFSEGVKPLLVQQAAGQRIQSLSHLLNARLSLASFKGEPTEERGDLYMNKHDHHDVGMELERVEDGDFHSRPESISHRMFDGYRETTHSAIRTSIFPPMEYTESRHQPTDHEMSHNHLQTHGSYIPSGDASLDRHIPVPDAASELAEPKRKYNKRSFIPQSMPDLSSTVKPQDRQENELLDSDRDILLKAQIPKKGRPVSRHSSKTQSISTLSSFSVPPASHPQHCSKTGMASSPLSLPSSNRYLPVRPPDLPLSPSYVDQNPSSMEGLVPHALVRRRHGRPPLTASVARHTHTQSHSILQSRTHSSLGSLAQFSEILHDNEYNENPSARKRSSSPLSPAVSPTMRSVTSCSQRPPSGGQHRLIPSYMDQCGESHEESPTKLFAVGLSAQIANRKRNSSDAEMHHSSDEHYPVKYQDGFIPSWHDVHRQYRGSSEDGRSRKRISRSDASSVMYDSDNKDEETPIHSWNGSRSDSRRPRSWVLPHSRSYQAQTTSHQPSDATPSRNDTRSKYEYDAHLYDPSSRDQVFRRSHSNISRSIHSHTRSLDISYSMSSFALGHLGHLGHPSQSHRSTVPIEIELEHRSTPRRHALTGPSLHLSSYPSTPTSPPPLVTSAHPGKPESSVPLVPAVQEKPAIVGIQAVPSILSISSAPSYSEPSLKPCLQIALSHAPPSFHSSSSIYPSPDTSLSSRFESSMNSTSSTLDLKKSSQLTATSSSSPCTYLSSPLCNPGNEYGAFASDTPHYSINAEDRGLDHKSASSSNNITMTTRADLLAREMSRSSYLSTVARSQSSTTPSQPRAPFKRSSKKGSGPYLKKHQILQLQLQQLQREQEEMELHLSLQQQQYKHQHHRQQQHQQRAQRHSMDSGRRHHLQKNFDIFTEQHPHSQQPLPGRPPKQRVMLRTESSSSVLHNSHTSSQNPQPPRLPTSQHRHLPQSSPPPPSTKLRPNHQQSTLLKTVSLPSLANLDFAAPSSGLNRPPPGQPRYRSLQSPCVVSPSTQVGIPSNTSANSNQNSSTNTVWNTGVQSPPYLSNAPSLATSPTLLRSTTPPSSGSSRCSPPHQQQYQQHPRLMSEYQPRSSMVEKDRIFSGSTSRSSSRSGASTSTRGTILVDASSQQSLHRHSSSLPAFHYRSSSQSLPSLQRSYPVSQDASDPSHLPIQESM